MYTMMSTSDPRSDAQLLRASVRDAEAFGVFYTRHARVVADYFAKRAGDRALVADLTSETFAQAFANRRRYRDTGAPATAWLFTIARRQLNEFYRTRRLSVKYRSRLGLRVDTSSDGFDRIEDLDQLRQLHPLLHESLDSLSKPAAEAVMLRIGHRWSYQAIAEHLGCSPGAARVRVSRALHTLHEHLEGAGYERTPTPADNEPKTGGNQ